MGWISRVRDTIMKGFILLAVAAASGYAPEFYCRDTNTSVYAEVCVPAFADQVTPVELAQRRGPGGDRHRRAQVRPGHPLPPHPDLQQGPPRPRPPRPRLPRQIRSLSNPSHHSRALPAPLFQLVWSGRYKLFIYL